ncbi:MAG: iron ABC transporter permease [Oscillospiraceae bacterium]|jgi:iron complex transport system permease protein|nr:iron ABC transporter permease [Oscillospiraceae bacterium]
MSRGSLSVKKLFVTALVCAAALAVCVLLSLAFGSRPISFSAFINGLRRADSGLIEEIVVRERIPRTVFGLLAGASLGVSGALMQAVTRNPIADPGILGVNTGAAFAVVCGVAFLGISRPSEYIWLALGGAAISAAIVYAIGSSGHGGATPIKLALSGAAFSAAVSSLTSAVLLPRERALNTFRFWQVGGVGGATWDGMLTIAPFLAAGLLLGLLSSPSLNAIALGDDVAASLGVRTGRARVISAAAGVLLCGATTALAGPIGFVGLMVPHAVRLIVGADQRKILPLSAVGGAALLTLSDIIGRILGRPGELEVGVVTAFIGAPALIAIAMRSKVKHL